MNDLSIRSFVDKSGFNTSVLVGTTTGHPKSGFPNQSPRTPLLAIGSDLLNDIIRNWTAGQIWGFKISGVKISEKSGVKIFVTFRKNQEKQGKIGENRGKKGKFFTLSIFDVT